MKKRQEAIMQELQMPNQFRKKKYLSSESSVLSKDPKWRKNVGIEELLMTIKHRF